LKELKFNLSKLRTLRTLRGLYMRVPRKTTKTKKTKRTTTISIRVLGASTSITIRNDILALWVLMQGDDIEGIERIRQKLSSFVLDTLSDWKGSSAKGLSEYITKRMIESFLEKRDIRMYRKILDVIQG
jgi:hypothetical protein